MLDELLQRLGAMGIEPLGTLEKIPSLVEQRTWVPNSQASAEGEDLVDNALEAAIKEAGA